MAKKRKCLSKVAFLSSPFLENTPSKYFFNCLKHLALPIYLLSSLALIDGLTKVATGCFQKEYPILIAPEYS